MSLRSLSTSNLSDCNKKVKQSNNKTTKTKSLSNPKNNSQNLKTVIKSSQSQNQNSKSANTLDELLKYLLTFNKQEETVRNSLNNKSLEDFSFRINLPLKLLNILSLKAYSLFKNEPNMLYLKAPFYVFGDIHGQYSDLIRFIELVGLPPKVKLLFLGDYVDRGSNSLEVIALLFSLKIKYPKHVFLLRGNHECSQVNDNYGFLEECIERYGHKDGRELWNGINQTFRMLPLCSLINKKIFCTHGGISPELKSFNQLEKINRNCNIPNQGIICDLTWADPKRQVFKYKDNDRGVSYTFNKDALKEFKERLNLDLVIRAHQVVDKGYQFFDEQNLVTVFSAPNYCGYNGNNGAVLKIKKNLDCSFIILQPTTKKMKKQKSLSISSQN